MNTIDVLVELVFGLLLLLLALISKLTHGFTFQRRNQLPQHVPAMSWGCKGKFYDIGLSWDRAVETYPCTPWMEDLPVRCFDCGFQTQTYESDYIGGDIRQYMVVVRCCVKGCGYSVWIA